MQRSAMASAILGFSVFASSILAQEKSVRPGVNDSFRDLKVSEFQEKFEIESREVFAKRKEIVEVCKVAPGMAVADIGAGTGVFSRLFSEAVFPKGQVFAVDTSSNLLEHINNTNREAGRKNIQTVQCTPDSTKLEPAMKHVRAGQEVFEVEILSYGFKKVREHSDLLKENYCIEFERVEPTK